jgi:DMSO/TMAO reductase YedYZ molybdopterin-dependent catalytic subunit
MMMTKRPSWLYGLLVGVITVPALIALLFLGNQLAGLPFIPFDLFDLIGRVLPGPVITFGIDSIVAFVTAIGLGGDIDSAAKTAELALAVVIFFGLFVVISIAFFLIMNRLKVSRSNIPGMVFALAVAVPFGVISLSINLSASAGDVLSAAWILLTFGGWAFVVATFYYTLAAFETANDLNLKTQGLDRRQFLVRVGGASAVLTVVGAGLGGLIGIPATTSQAALRPEGTPDPNAPELPNANDPVVAAPGTRAEVTAVEDHYRIDISALPPVIAEEGYTLKIHGAVENPVEWTLADIRAMPSQEAYLTMSCISNPIGGSLISSLKWTGVSFQYILDQIKPTSDAVALRIVGADNFDEYVMLDFLREDGRAMLAYWWDDQPLPTANGFPLRTHFPNRYGMKQPKWITDIEVVTEHQDGYWVRRGWSEEALVRATSVVDTVAAEAVYNDSGTWYVPVGGIAWAGDRGISKVEVRVDGGEWMEAKLRTPISDRMWTIWRYDWEFVEGQHKFEVRCMEGDGVTPQLEGDRPTRPDGATGIDELNTNLDPLPA